MASLSDVIGRACQNDAGDQRDIAWERIVCRMLLSSSGVSRNRVSESTDDEDGSVLSLARVLQLVTLPFGLGLKRLSNPHELFEMVVQPKSKDGFYASRFWRAFTEASAAVDRLSDWFVLAIPMAGPGALAIHEARFAADLPVSGDSKSSSFRFHVGCHNYPEMCIEPLRQVLAGVRNIRLDDVYGDGL